ncbi:hypothetical protein [Streptomyces sp. IBSBF 3136]|uniref:hypothetical protein n=1 Tax=Streptomyces sp. IBSBF 3136 TaxID=2903524 RepID=UPI002FDBA3CA
MEKTLLSESGGRLTVRRADGQKDTIAVDDPVYHAAYPGASTKLTVWKNRIVKFETAGKTSTVVSGASTRPGVLATLLIGLRGFTTGMAIQAGRRTPWKTLWRWPLWLFAAATVAITGILVSFVIGLSSQWTVAFAVPAWLWSTFILTSRASRPEDTRWA